MIKYDSLTWLGEDEVVLHAVNLYIDDIYYGNPILNKNMELFHTLKDYAVQNDLVLAHELTGDLTGFTREDAVLSVLQKRNSNLRKTDYIFVSDYPVEEHFTEEELVEIRAYRQALRDITKDEAYPYIVLPAPPTCLFGIGLAV